MPYSLISHIGIAVADLEQAIATYKTLTGQSKPRIETVEDQKVKTAIFAGTGDGPVGARIELVAATSNDSPIAKFIDKRGEGLHHICIHVDDIDARLAELKQAGVRLIDESPRTGVEGGRIAFVHPSSCNGVLVELEERR